MRGAAPELEVRAVWCGDLADAGELADVVVDLIADGEIGVGAAVGVADELGAVGGGAVTLPVGAQVAIFDDGAVGIGVGVAEGLEAGGQLEGIEQQVHLHHLLDGGLHLVEVHGLEVYFVGHVDPLGGQVVCGSCRVLDRRLVVAAGAAARHAARRGTWGGGLAGEQAQQG